MTRNPVRIGITIGDPCGVGPEVVSGALRSSSLPRDCEFVVIGDSKGFSPGKPNADSARTSLDALERSVKMAADGDIHAVVTAPVSKHGLHEIGFDFPGQTEFFAARANIKNYAMLLTGGKLTVALVTTHVPLKDAVALLSPAEITRVGDLLAEHLVVTGKMPRIAVAGLNPHAGEQGDIGREEIDLIAPAVGALQSRWNSRADFSGPYSPDAIFRRAVNGEFDAVLCMYHDQGLIPLKLHAFDQGVNVTLGLPYVRTSPDHGTAFEIAGKGTARPDSMIAAIRLAAELSRARLVRK